MEPLTSNMEPLTSTVEPLTSTVVGAAIVAAVVRAGWQQRRSQRGEQSCALVGNSGSLNVGNKYSEAIDSHGVVVRLNQAPTKGCEPLTSTVNIHCEHPL
eukprot:683931-Prorocentrum_minimum.AAC.2